MTRTTRVVAVTDPTTPEAPLLRVVRGTPSDEELAALVVVLAARARAASTAAGGNAPRRSAWASYWHTHRTAITRLTPAAGATDGWRASALPR